MNKENLDTAILSFWTTGWLMTAILGALTRVAEVMITTSLPEQVVGIMVTWLIWPYYLWIHFS